MDKDLVTLDLKDERLTRHAVLIKARNKIVTREMVLLAKELFTISLYTEHPTVVLENCRLTVQMRRGQTLDVWFYLKKLAKGDKNVFTWRDILRDVAKSKNMTSMSEFLREIREERRRMETDHKSVSKAIASFGVSDVWNVVDRSFNLNLMRLLPAARALANERLNELMVETQGEMAYMESAAAMAIEGGE